MHFNLRIDLTDHEHRGNIVAQHEFVGQMLDLAKQQLGSDRKRSGTLTIPRWDVSLGINHHAPIGSWAFEDETRNPNAEA
jgi:hypothetical protein